MTQVKSEIRFPYFRGITIEHKIKTDEYKKYIGVDKEINTHDDRIKSLIKNYEKDPNIMYWAYKDVEIEFINPLNNLPEKVRPSFHIFTNGGEVNPLHRSIDKVYEYIIELTMEFDVNMNYLTDEQLSYLSPVERKQYILIMNKMSYQLNKYEAIGKYCRENGIKFILSTDDNDIEFFNYKKEHKKLIN